MMMAEVGESLKVTGRRREMVAEGPMPGRTPIRVPIRHPMKHRNRLFHCKAV
jgi:hypothetical protein